MKKQFFGTQFACLALASFLTVGLSSCASNSSDFDVDKIIAKESLLTGKTIYWLGSSVTYGYKSNGVSMADYVAANSNAICVKEAVTGTTLLDETNWSGKSYLTRMKESSAFKKDASVDAFVCQISTNDCRKENLSKWGKVSPSTEFDLNSFDTKTTLGALEYIVGYVKETWSCPVFLYSGAAFTDKGPRSCSNPLGSDYGKLIEECYSIADKWNAKEEGSVQIIDLFNNEEFNNISDEDYHKYMCDPIHPYKAGYQLWWTPEIEAELISGLSK